ncbi:CYTH and CHAD domain-containing protein [Methylobacterium sp. NEAU K]|uniref:CYTH and CHAD domain-containing protein n=1 Tax=Methylobacterium sp. NEAU K TaxID=3064946 RepID=UPI00273480CA|nr:CYTH and CHAD domain-containing protein [Methylobacterium sp. NEAU K]MDP4006624.1 CHAD domain-containing protein [Methylobacterium sp. NEAU K]
MSEPREIELKLKCEPSDLATLQAHPLLQEASEQRETDLTSIYFDTAEQRLREAGLELRIRQSGERFIQTLKAEGDGLFNRPEWEQEVSGPEPDLAALVDTPLRKVLRRKDQLQPLFTTIVRRRTYLVEQGSSRIEVALDSGQITAPSAGDRATTVCEVELELKEGSSDDVFVLADAVAALVPLHLGVRSKAERGYSLVSGDLDRVRKAEPVPLRVDMSAAEAFQSIAHACLRHMRLNEDILLKGRDVEALHQVRVAIRRLRSAFSLFGDLVEDGPGTRIKAELKRLTQPLGQARNLDVFLATTLPVERQRHPDEAGLLNLETQLEDHRTKAYEAVERLLRSPEWRTLLLDLVAWINSGPWLRADDRDGAGSPKQPAREFSARELDRRRRQVKKRGRHLDELGPEDRHKVRIAAKKLRYGVEFFARLYPNQKAMKRHAAFTKVISRLQDHLGALNDIATGHEVVRQVASEHAGASALFAAGMTVADLEARTHELLTAAAEAHKELVDTKPFWRFIAAAARALSSGQD